jgi:hypothetical protein
LDFSIEQFDISYRRQIRVPDHFRLGFALQAIAVAVVADDAGSSSQTVRAQPQAMLTKEYATTISKAVSFVYTNP